MWFQKHSEERKKLSLKEIGLPRLIIVFLAGIFILVLSIPSGGFSGSKEKKKEDTDVINDTVDSADAAWLAVNRYAGKQEEQLKVVLEKVEGVGKVDVMITLASSEEKVTLNNENVSQESTQEKDSGGGTRNNSSYQDQKDQVLVDGEEGQQPYIVQLQAPVIEGVVVVAQGAGKGRVDTEIIQAVEALFPIEPHKIKVMKMS